MSVGKVSSGQEGYYLSAVAHGAEDYYSERGEVPGRWIGSAADELGLAGEVEDDAFRAVLSGADPSTGVRLRRSNGRVCAFDLTLSAPKFFANAAWLGYAVLAHNLIRWTAQLGDVHPDNQLTVARTIRTRLIALPGRIVNRSGRHTLRLPTRWPWADGFLDALTRLRAIPQLT